MIFLLIIVFFVLDRYLKALALKLIPGQAYDVLGGYLRFDLAPNHYAAFSLPLSGTLFEGMIVVAILALAGLSFYYYFKERRQKLIALALTAITVGAISNLWDRWQQGFVIDYLDLRYFTVFNGADIMITLGAAYVLWRSWKDRDKASN